MNNNVEHPSHYNQGGIECIDAMISAFGKEEVMDWCRLNAFKYLWRSEEKNGIEDWKKCQWYVNKMIELRESGPVDNIDKDLENCYPDCVHWSDDEDEWCKTHCKCGVCPTDPKYNELPYMYS